MTSDGAKRFAATHDVTRMNWDAVFDAGMRAGLTEGQRLPQKPMVRLVLRGSNQFLATIAGVGVVAGWGDLGAFCDQVRRVLPLADRRTGTHLWIVREDGHVDEYSLS